jgi:hypothetical protein
VKNTIATRKNLSKARPGNTNAVKTGLRARSKSFQRLRDNQVGYYVRNIRAMCPWLIKSDYFLIRRFAQCELLCDVLYAELRERGPLDKSGEAKRLLGEWRKLVAAQGSLANQLGLSPQARAAIKTDATKPVDISDADAQRAIDVSSTPSDEQS